MSNLDTIRERRAAIAAQRTSLDREDAELAVAERVLARMAGEEPAPVNAMTSLVRPRDALSRRDKVLDVLSGEAVWMNSREINAAIFKKHGAFIKGSSFFPMLTTLKNEGVILREGDKMALKSRVDKE